MSTSQLEGGDSGPRTESLQSQLAAVESVRPAAGPPRFEDRFQACQELARGGQGRVLVARDVVLGREVALKEPLQAGSAGVLARFEREARLSARLQHPGIVSIYELVRRTSGEPVLVMRRVQGTPFDRAIAEAPSYEARLGLLPRFIALCDAIAYTHRQGLIHRDVKPANVLLGEFGDTVVIDWGVAKELGAPLPGAEPPASAPESAELTAAGALVGTPAYMSPQQARGEPAGVQADVYALGATLYHLLAGQVPYSGATGQDVLAAVRDGPPPPIDSLVSALAPELRTMVERAMARDPALRYQTVAELAEELKQYQTGQLVHSHSYSTWQLVRRWARRHALPLTVAGVSFTLLAAGAAIGVRRILAERERANREAATARRALDFMTGIFKVSDPLAMPGGAIDARAILDQAARQIETGLTEEPELQARLMQTLGTVYSNLGIYPRAQELLEKAGPVFAQRQGLDSADAIDATVELAVVLRREKKFPEAEKKALEASQRAVRALGADDPVSLKAQSQLGVIYRQQRRLEMAEAVLSDGLQAARRKLGADHPISLQLLNNLANTELDLRHPDKAAALVRELIERSTRIEGKDHPNTIGAVNNLAAIAVQLGRTDEALALFQRVVEADRRVLGAEHPETLLALGNVATVLYEQKRYAEAEPISRELLAARQRRLGPDNPATLESMDDLGALLSRLGRLDEAEALLQQALAGLRVRRSGTTGPEDALANLALIAAQRGDKEGAIGLLTESFAAGLSDEDKATVVGDARLDGLRADARFVALAAPVKKK